jgi:hypothetical protein
VDALVDETANDMMKPTLFDLVRVANSAARGSGRFVGRIGTCCRFGEPSADLPVNVNANNLMRPILRDSVRVVEHLQWAPNPCSLA